MNLAYHLTFEHGIFPEKTIQQKILPAQIKQFENPKINQMKKLRRSTRSELRWYDNAPKLMKQDKLQWIRGVFWSNQTRNLKSQGDFWRVWDWFRRTTNERDDSDGATTGTVTQNPQRFIFFSSLKFSCHHCFFSLYRRMWVSFLVIWCICVCIPIRVCVHEPEK